MPRHVGLIETVKTLGSRQLRGAQELIHEHAKRFCMEKFLNLRRRASVFLRVLGKKNLRAEGLNPQNSQGRTFPAAYK